MADDGRDAEGRRRRGARGLVGRPVSALYHGVVEPLLALRLKRARLQPFGLRPGDPLPTALLELLPDCRCAPTCRFDLSAREEVIDRYVAPRDPRETGAPAPLARTRLTPTAIDLARFPDAASFEALVRKRSSRTLPKIRAAARAGYVVHRFPLKRHVEDVHAVKTSKPVRAAGPVLDYWLLKPEHVGRQATEPFKSPSVPCRRHWQMWWGAFLPEPGHAQGGVEVGERLVGYVKTVRVGDLVHYADIMGHRDHLSAGVMAAIHLEIMRWLLARRDPAAGGVRAVLYGAAEHGREGLLVWKRRAGFEPLRLAFAPETKEGRA